MSEYVLTSPDGSEYRTGSAVLRSRLVAQGYRESKSEAESEPQQAASRPAPRQRQQTQTQHPAPVVQDGTATS